MCSCRKYLKTWETDGWMDGDSGSQEKTVREHFSFHLLLLTHGRLRSLHIKARTEENKTT